MVPALKAFSMIAEAALSGFRLAVGQKFAHDHISVVDEFLQDFDMVKVVPPRLVRTTFRQHVDQGTGERHHDRRMGRDHKLRPLRYEVMEAADECEASKRRHRCLGLVKYVESPRTKTMHREREKRLSVRNLM